MAPRTFASRLEKLQAALAAQLSKPIASIFLPFEPDATADDYEAVRESEIDKLVDAGEIGPNQRNRVLAFRWMTAAENEDRVKAGVGGPVPERPVEASPTEGCASAPASNVQLEAPASSEEDRRAERFNRPLDLPDLGII